jgi:hypothetical protein
MLFFHYLAPLSSYCVVSGDKSDTLLDSLLLSVSLFSDCIYSLFTAFQQVDYDVSNIFFLLFILVKVY